MTQLGSLLFGSYRRQILALLLLRPESAYHVREIARLTNTSAGTLHKELRKLAAVGILKKVVTGNQVSYSADTNCVIYHELKSIINKTSGIAEVLRQNLEPLMNQCTYAGIFGSTASGTETSHSDIDILIVGSVTFAEVIEATFALQQKFGREINPKIYSVDEWIKAAQDGRSFIHDLMAKPMLTIVGDKDDFRQFTQQFLG